MVKNSTTSEPKLFNRDFILLWQGQLVSQFGSQIFALTLLYWVYEVTGSATLMGLIMMAASLPGALLGPFGGTLADNISRKFIIVSMDLVRGLACLAFVAAIEFSDPHSAIRALIVTQVVFGLAQSAFGPALQASIPALVPAERLASANSMMQGFGSALRVLSFAVGGFMYATLGAPFLFLVNGASYFVSGAASSFVHVPQKMPEVPLRLSNAARRFADDTLMGVKYVWSIRGLRKIFLAAAVLNFVLIPVTIAQPIFVRDFLHKNAAFLGLFAAANGSGGIAGFLLVGTMQVRDHQRAAAFLVANALFAVSLGLIAFLQNPASALLLFFTCGLTLPVANVMVQTVIQGTVPTEVRGRVMGVLGTVATGLVPIAMGLSGLLIDWLDGQVPPLWYMCSGIMLLVVVYLGISTDFREYINSELSPRAADLE